MDINNYFFQIDSRMTTAYLTGKDDFYNGRQRCQNPYEVDTEEYNYWDMGWSESKHEGDE